MFSLLGVLSMEGRVWFEDKPYEDKPLRYCYAHIRLSFFSPRARSASSSNTDTDGLRYDKDDRSG